MRSEDQLWLLLLAGIKNDGWMDGWMNELSNFSKTLHTFQILKYLISQFVIFNIYFIKVTKELWKLKKNKNKNKNKNKERDREVFFNEKKSLLLVSSKNGGWMNE